MNKNIASKKRNKRRNRSTFSFSKLGAAVGHVLTYSLSKQIVGHSLSYLGWDTTLHAQTGATCEQVGNWRDNPPLRWQLPLVEYLITPLATLAPCW